MRTPETPHEIPPEGKEPTPIQKEIALLRAEIGRLQEAIEKEQDREKRNELKRQIAVLYGKIEELEEQKGATKRLTAEDLEKIFQEFAVPEEEDEEAGPLLSKGEIIELLRAVGALDEETLKKIDLKFPVEEGLETIVTKNEAEMLLRSVGIPEDKIKEVLERLGK